MLLDPEVLHDPSTQALVLTVLATMVKYSTSEEETRVLYQYLAEGSVVFPKVFPVMWVYQYKQPTCTSTYLYFPLVTRYSIKKSIMCCQYQTIKAFWPQFKVSFKICWRLKMPANSHYIFCKVVDSVVSGDLQDHSQR